MKKLIKVCVLLFFLSSEIIFAQTNPNNSNQTDSLKIIWNAILNQKKIIDSLIQNFENNLKKAQISQINNKKDIEEINNLKNQVEQIIKNKNHSNFNMPIIYVIIFFLPFFILILFIIYLRYKQKKELNIINENLHQYINESKKLIDDLANELEKTSTEVIEKAKNRINLLELMIIEAGKKNKIQQQNNNSMETPSNLKQTINSGTNIYSKYEKISNLKNNTLTPSPLPSEKNSSLHTNSIDTILFLKKRGLSNEEIAKKLNMGVGEIELILNIHKKKNNL